MNRYFVLLENLGLLRRTAAYDRDYHRQYPGLARLEENYADVREECLALLGIKDQLTDMTALGAGYTNGGIHTAQWKAFMFKSGNRFIEENCVQAPKTRSCSGDSRHGDGLFLHLRCPGNTSRPTGAITWPTCAITLG